MKTVHIFFGEMGCGKTYCGSNFAKMHGFKFFEGDSVVTPRMLEKVIKFKPIPRDVLEEYMDVLFNAIADQMDNTDNLVVSQALYLNQDREALKLFLESFGYTVKMWLVKCTWYQNIRNLLTRDNGWRWVYYWLINKPFFQKPTHESQIFLNIYFDNE
jgi:gluconate kinase